MLLLQRLIIPSESTTAPTPNTDTEVEHYATSNEWSQVETVAQSLKQVGVDWHLLTQNHSSLSQPLNEEANWIKGYPDVEHLLETYQLPQCMIIPCQQPSQRQVALEEQCYPSILLQLVLEGEILFAFRHENAIYECFCQPGDTLILPENTPFWMDLGEEPKAVLLRALPEGVPPRAKRTGLNHPDKSSRLVDLE